MRVGLDGRALASPIRSGVEHYVLQLTRALARLDDGPEIIAYLDRPMPEPERQQILAGRVRDRVVRTPRGWLRAGLPWRLWRDGADLVHLPSTIMPPLLPCPAVVTVHDLAWARYPDTYEPADLRAQQTAATRSVRRAARVIAVSESTARDLTQLLGVPRKRITVAPLGVSEQFSPDGPGIRGDEFEGASRLTEGYLLHTGGLHRRKNVNGLLSAYARVRRETQAPPLVIVGGGRAAGELAEAARWLGCGDDVLFTGLVGTDILPALYRAATLVVYPSLYEGFGLPILEAMASGTPVISSGQSSMPEVAGDAAVLVHPQSVEEMAEAVIRVLRDPRLREELARRGLERARRFRWERTAQLTVEAYEQALDSIA